MELKNKKYIKNTGSLPGFVNGLPNGLSSVDYQQSLGNWINQLESYNSKPSTVNSKSNVNIGYNGLTTGFLDFGANDFVNQEYGSQIQPKMSVSTSNIRTPITQNVAPVQNNSGPVYSNGVLDMNPGAKGFNKSTKSINWSGAGDVVTTGVNFMGQGINAFTHDETESDLAAQYGQAQGNAGGIGYVRPNYADVGEQMAQVRKKNLTNTLGAAGGGAAFGAAVGSIIPGLGTVVGGLIGAGLGALIGGAGSAKRAREHRQMVNRYNDKALHLGTDAEGWALTKAMQLNNAEENGVPDKQLIYGHANGKQPEVNSKTGRTKDDVLMYTPRGYKFGKANALGEPGETMLDTETGEISTIPYRPGDSKHPGDVQPIEAKKETAIFTNRWIDPVTGKSFAKAAIDGDDDPYALLNRMKILVNDNKSKKGLMKAKCGKLPKYYEGWIPNAISSGATMLGGLAQYLDAKNQSVKKPNSYVSNPYEMKAFETLAGLRINPYPISLNLKNAELRTNRAIDVSGGLSVGQRKLQRLAALNQTQRNISDALANIEMQNNSYFSDYAKTALQAGMNNAKMAMAANQYDLDYYSKAHAARQQGMQAGMYNLINGMQQYYANDFKRRQFNDTMGLYREQLDIDKQKTLADIQNMAFNQKQAQKQSQNQTVLNPYQWLAFGPSGYYGAMQYNRKLATKHS